METEGRGYGRRQMRKAKRKAKKGTKIADRMAAICSRSLKSGKGCRNKQGWMRKN
jgi:hypothetical protein